MNSFHSFATPFTLVFPSLLSDSTIHAKWLNTLSYLENCGAKKIARSEHRWDVSKAVLKHAAEEFRHAFYLKQQISTRLHHFLPDYRFDTLLGGWKTIHYLDRLELNISRAIQQHDPLISNENLKTFAYLLTTFAIELRAAELYPLYQRFLLETHSLVSVRSILLDEKNHLEEMHDQLIKFQIPSSLTHTVTTLEATLCSQWLCSLSL